MLKEEFDAFIEELKVHCIYRQFNYDSSECEYVFESFEVFDGLEFSFKYSEEHGCNIIETGGGIKCTDIKILEFAENSVSVELTTNGFTTAVFNIRRKNPLFGKFKEICSKLNAHVPHTCNSENAVTYNMDFKNSNSSQLQIFGMFDDESHIRFRIMNQTSGENFVITGEDVDYIDNQTECMLILTMANGFGITMVKLRKDK